MPAVPVTRLNHVVLYVSDIERSADFYTRAFGFDEIGREGPMAFFRAAGSSKHHDLALFGVGAAASMLAELDALTGMSDHGATKSLYGKDPDGIEFEVMWLVPRDQWGEYERRGV